MHYRVPYTSYRILQHAICCILGRSKLYHTKGCCNIPYTVYYHTSYTVTAYILSCFLLLFTNPRLLRNSSLITSSNLPLHLSVDRKAKGFPCPQLIVSLLRWEFPLLSRCCSRLIRHQLEAPSTRSAYCIERCGATSTPLISRNLSCSQIKVNIHFNLIIFSIT